MDIAVTEADPQSLFDEAIDAALCRKLESLGLIDADVDINVQRRVALEKFKQSLQKNGSSPVGGPGQNQDTLKPVPKAKGKGKSKQWQDASAAHSQRQKPNSLGGGKGRGRKGMRGVPNTL